MDIFSMLICMKMERKIHIFCACCILIFSHWKNFTTVVYWIQLSWIQRYKFLPELPICLSVRYVPMARDKEFIAYRNRIKWEYIAFEYCMSVSGYIAKNLASKSFSLKCQGQKSLSLKGKPLKKHKIFCHQSWHE